MEAAEKLAGVLLDTRSHLSVDALLDATTALVQDCDHPQIRKSRPIEHFLERYKRPIEDLQKRRIKICDFDSIKVIGRGAFGEVQLVRHRTSKKVFAMKSLDKSEMIRRADSAFFWDERDIMAHTDSEWIVRLYYAFQDARYLYMVMEYMPGGDLITLMSNYECNEQWAAFYIAELVLAVDVIHSVGYLHRDLKPENVLLDRRGHVKLADFGTCVKMDKDGVARCSSAVGTPDYISPEALQFQGVAGEFGPELDWWSVGVLLYELLIGETPFYADSLAGTYARIQNHDSQLEFPDDVPITPNAKDLIKRLLSDPKVRLGKKGVDEIKAHPFFTSCDWTFSTIRQATPPVVPELTSDDDTRWFEEVGPKQPNPGDGFQLPKAFTGNQLPFIGFTYSNELGPAHHIQLKHAATKATQNGSGPELIALRQDKQLAQLELSKVRADKDRFETDLGTTRVELKIQTEKLKEMENALEQERRYVESERQARNAAEVNAGTKDKEKTMMEVEMRQTIGRHERELKTKEMRIDSLVHSEISLRSETEKLQKSLAQKEAAMKSLEEALQKSLAQKEEVALKSLERQLQETELSQARVEKEHVETELRDLKLRNRSLEGRCHDQEETLGAERDVIELFKNELSTTRLELQMQAEKLKELEHALDQERRYVESERLARHIAEENASTNDMEKTMFEIELRQTIGRHERELKAKDMRIETLLQCEGNLRSELDALQQSLAQKEASLKSLERQLHETVNLATAPNKRKSFGAPNEMQSPFGPTLLKCQESFRSVSNASICSGDLSQLSKEQLIKCFDREKNMKELTIQKLREVSAQCNKYKNELSKKGRLDSNKKRGQEIATLQQQLNHEINKAREAEQLYEREKDELNKLLTDEQQCTDRLRDELAQARRNEEDLLAKLGETSSTTSRDIESQSARQNGDVDTYSNCSSSISTPNGSRSSAVVPLVEKIRNAGSEEVLLQSKCQLRASANLPKKVRKNGWIPVVTMISVSQLRVIGEDQTEIVIDVADIKHARNVKQPDIRSASEKELKRIFHILYTEPTTSGNLSICASMSSIATVAQSAAATHSFVEVSFHLPANCDFCNTRLNEFFRTVPALECTCCKKRYHKNHLEDPKFPACNMSRGGRELMLMCESSEERARWITMLEALIKRSLKASS